MTEMTEMTEMTVYEKLNELCPFTPRPSGCCLAGLRRCAGPEVYGVATAILREPDWRGASVEYKRGVNVDLLVLADALEEGLGEAARAYAETLRSVVKADVLRLAMRRGVECPVWVLPPAARADLMLSHNPHKFRPGSCKSSGWPFEPAAAIYALVEPLSGVDAQPACAWILGGGTNYANTVLFLAYLLPGAPHVFLDALAAG